MKHIYGTTVARKKVKAGREGKVKTKKQKNPTPFQKKKKNYGASVSSMDQHFIVSFCSCLNHNLLNLFLFLLFVGWDRHWIQMMMFSVPW